MPASAGLNLSASELPAVRVWIRAGALVSFWRVGVGGAVVSFSDAIEGFGVERGVTSADSRLENVDVVLDRLDSAVRLRYSEGASDIVESRLSETVLDRFISSFLAIPSGMAFSVGVLGPLVTPRPSC